jgi:uncharacterized damage-inducible protein DinB
MLARPERPSYPQFERRPSISLVHLIYFAFKCWTYGRKPDSLSGLASGGDAFRPERRFELKRLVPSFLIPAVLVALALFAALATSFAQQPPRKPLSPSEAVLRDWNDIGNKLIAMAQDWPEDKYSYRPNDQVRTFAQQLLHVAGDNYSLINAITGKKLGHEENDPSTEVFKSKAQVIEFLKKSVTDGAAAIQQLGDDGIVKRLGPWVGYIEHMSEHYGQLVVYYRNNGVVPPDSRPKPKS